MNIKECAAALAKEVDEKLISLDWGTGHHGVKWLESKIAYAISSQVERAKREENEACAESIQTVQIRGRRMAAEQIGAWALTVEECREQLGQAIRSRLTKNTEEK